MLETTYIAFGFSKTLKQIARYTMSASNDPKNPTHLRIVYVPVPDKLSCISPGVSMI